MTHDEAQRTKNINDLIRLERKVKEIKDRCQKAVAEYEHVEAPDPTVLTISRFEDAVDDMHRLEDQATLASEILAIIDVG